MNESTRRRIRRDYAPLTVSTTLRCLTPASPIGQVYNALLEQYEPNRSLTPTTIFPDVQAGAKDGSWAHRSVNEQLTSMVWYVDGVDITTLSDWSGKYTITTEGEYKGAISISMNVPTRVKYALSFSAEFADTRLGMNVQVRSDSVILSTTDKGDDDYSIGIDCENSLRYNITRDQLELYEYQVAHGITPTVTEAAAKATGESYVREIGLTVRRGTTVITSGFDVKLYELSGTTERERTAAYGTEITGFRSSLLTFDLRLVLKADYVLKVLVDSKVVAQVQLSVDRIYPTVYCSPSNGTSILNGDRVRYDKAMVSLDGQILECPARAVAILWKVDSYSMTGVTFNEGETTQFELSKTGLGEKDGENWLDIYTDYELKGEYKVATDASGNTYTDENGNIIIFR